MAKRPDPSKPAFIVGDSLADIFAEAGISLGKKSVIPGGDVKVMCPACHGGRSKELSLSIKVDSDSSGAAWHCFRGNCPGSSSVPGSGKLQGHHDNVPRRRDRPIPVKPVLHTQAEQQRPDSMYGLFERRGISRETVDEFGIYAVSRRWPKTDEAGAEMRDAEGERIWTDKPTIVFPYRWRGEVVNRKFRSKDKQFQQDRDSQRTFFNADAVETPDVVVLVEGEFDVLASWEAGLRQVISLPDGSPQKLYDEDDERRADDKRFDPLENCAEILADVAKIIIATDADVPGGYLAEEFARRLGRERCWRVTWPDGCKDANDVLMKHGPEVLAQCVEAARPWPLTGLFDMQPGTLQQFLTEGREPRGLKCGIGALDEIARLPEGPGWLTVITGIPNHGKGAFLKCWLAYHAMKNDLGIVWCSPEDNRPENLALGIAEVVENMPAREAGTIMPSANLAHAEAWIRERIDFVYADDPDTEMTLEWLLARAEQAKRRRRRNLLVLDPWNEVEHQVGARETEVQYVNRWLRRLKAWGRAEGFSVIIAAHPRQQVRDPKTDQYRVVDGYDINGGAPWNNKADLGLTVYRRVEGQQEITCWKPRYRAFGERGGVAKLNLNNRTGRLSSIGAEVVVPEQQPYQEGDET